MPNFSRIDDSNRADHPRLNADDEVYYLYEYTSRKNYNFSATNQLIANLKKKPSRAAFGDYKYKGIAIRDCGVALGGAINHAWLNGATLVPVPPSKQRDHADYDDRITRICRAIPVSFALDIRELVVQVESTDAFHEGGTRLAVDELLALYSINEAVAAPLPQRIAIIDDVLTAGTHYRAMATILGQRFPGVNIVGMFIARRVFPDDAAADFEAL